LSDSDLIHRTRPAAGDPVGALVLFHGRGADEHDLFPLLDLVDPQRRLVGATPRGPLALPPGGAHWYQIRALGYPDPDTFTPTYDRAGAWLDAWLEHNGVPAERAVIGGFSQGCVMSYAFGLGSGRARPAGLMAFSGFIPTVPGWEMAASNAQGLPVIIGHGSYDPVIEVEWGRKARAELEAAGADVTYREYPLPHAIDPSFLTDVRAWLDDVLG
jgi:phospholipase/carboxylesterase